MNIRETAPLREEREDRAEILNVLDGENRAFMAKDFEKMASFWTCDEQSERWNALLGQVFRGHSAFAGHIRAAMLRNPEPIKSKRTTDMLELRVGADQAWMTCIERMRSETVNYDLHTLKILERRDGAWKIACIVDMPCQDLVADVPMLTVKSSGQIIVANALAEERLKDHPHLVVSKGYLRARSASGARALREAFLQAPAVLSCLDPGYVPQSPQNKKFPVMLGDVNHGDVAVCWITPATDHLYVAFDDFGSLAQRIEMARIVFRLSPNQTQVAKLIAEGFDSPVIAERLGVTPHTVRTHLRRIFEKTGVSNQTALVRVLLSVGG